MKNFAANCPKVVTKKIVYLYAGSKGAFKSCKRSKLYLPSIRSSSTPTSLNDGPSSPLTEIDEQSPVRGNSWRLISPAPTKANRKLRTPRKSGYASARNLPKTVVTQSTSNSSNSKKSADPFAALMRAKNASERRKPSPVGLNLDLSLSPIGDQFDRPPLSPLLTPLRLTGEDKTMDWEKIFGEDEKANKTNRA